MARVRLQCVLPQVRGIPCDCAYPEDCDSQLSTLPPTRKALAAAAAAAAAAAVDGATGDSAEASHSGSGDKPESQAPADGTVYSAAAPSAHVVCMETADSAANEAREPPCAGAGRLAAAELRGDRSEAALQRLEDCMVNGVYNAIAPHFSATRCGSYPHLLSVLVTQ